MTPFDSRGTGAIADVFHAMGEAERKSRREQRVIWLLGAGFSKALGGPLFAEMFEPAITRWVSAWVQWRNCGNLFKPSEAIQAYVTGVRTGLWSNAEECLALFDAARTDELTRAFLDSNMGPGSGVTAEQFWISLSQFVAVATSYFVDRIHAEHDLPEAWDPYLAWAQCLSQNDSIISFNYDLVVEELLKRTKSNCGLLVKLHGSVPDSKELRSLLSKGAGIETISTPGPRKVLATRDSALASEWDKAKAVLEKANRLVVIGYSFPASDSAARSFVLRHTAAQHVTVVVGANGNGEAIKAMFQRRRTSVLNTDLLAEQFLAEGSVIPNNDRFDHSIFKDE